MTHYRIDADHSNAYTAWQRLGSPQKPTPDEYAALESAGQLAEIEPASSVEIANGTATVRFPLPRQCVSLLVLNCDASP